MSKQQNRNIGVIDCAHCGEPAAVREDRSRKLYYQCLDCGQIRPNMPGGQDWMISNASLAGGTGDSDDSMRWPEGTPDWIRENWPWAKALRERDRPVNRDDPPAAPGPTPGPAPEQPAPDPEANPGAGPVNEPARPAKGGGMLDFLDDF